MNNKRNYYVEKLLERIEKQKEMQSNPNYINWLEKFTEKYPRFTDNDFLYDKKLKSLEDNECIDNLNLFYKIIEEYFEKNYIYLEKNSDFSRNYKIKYNGIGYKIGCMIGQGTLFYCERISNPDDTYLDYNDILSNKKQPHTDEINKILEELTTIIFYYHENGVPLQALKISLNEAIKTLYDDVKRKDKKLKKTYE